MPSFRMFGGDTMSWRPAGRRVAVAFDELALAI
jgi:hypothetical protein